jgi:hypothetical protein
MVTNVSVEPAASIFRFEEDGKADLSDASVIIYETTT